MNFLERIFQRLHAVGNATGLQEIRGNEIVPAGGKDLLEQIARARSFIIGLGLKTGERCALLAPNSVRWVAADLALMSEGVIVVPLYARQVPSELMFMIRDSGASHVFCGNQELRESLLQAGFDATRISVFDQIFSATLRPSESAAPSPGDSLTIIYTSGTSGEPKGVILTSRNLEFMLSCTERALDGLMCRHETPEQVFQYGPFSLAASWILLLSCLLRNSVLSLSTDLTKLADEMRIAKPHYMLNVPTLLERVRRRVEEQVTTRGGWIAATFRKAQQAYLRDGSAIASVADRLALAAARLLIFPTIRKGIGPRLEALICGSAPLSIETQKFFMMMGIKVLQVYGLTETTAICTLDDPAFVEPGTVGPAIPGIEMKTGDDHEILVRGPNIFAGYWDRPDETANALRDGWFHTGDQGEMNSHGHWKITGRVKNLIILNSGHNIAPEPLEEELAGRLPGAQVMLVGNGHSYLAALVAGANSGLTDAKAHAAIDAINARLPHYRQIRAFHLLGEPFTIESGMLTLNGKLRRGIVAAHFQKEIEQLYQKPKA